MIKSNLLHRVQSSYYGYTLKTKNWSCIVFVHDVNQLYDLQDFLNEESSIYILNRNEIKNQQIYSMQYSVRYCEYNVLILANHWNEAESIKQKLKAKSVSLLEDFEETTSDEYFL